MTLKDKLDLDTLNRELFDATYPVLKSPLQVIVFDGVYLMTSCFCDFLNLHTRC